MGFGSLERDRFSAAALKMAALNARLDGDGDGMKMKDMSCSAVVLLDEKNALKINIYATLSNCSIQEFSYQRYLIIYWPRFCTFVTFDVNIM